MGSAFAVITETELMNTPAEFMKSSIGGMAVAALLGLAAQASAAVVTVTYSGTVSSGTDYAGLFGVAGASLTGLAFTSVQAFDTSIGRSTDVKYSGFEAHQLSGAALGATLVINGRTFVFDGDYFSLIDVRLDNGSYGINHKTYGPSGLSRISSYVGGIGISPAPPISVAGAYSWNLLMGGTGLGDAFSYVPNGTGFSTQFSVELTGTSLDIQVTSPVPEPAGYLMLVFGLGVVGYFAQRREKLAA